MSLDIRSIRIKYSFRSLGKVIINSLSIRVKKIKKIIWKILRLLIFIRSP